MNYYTVVDWLVNDELLQSPPMRRTLPISFRIKEEIKEQLERLAKADKRSLSQYIELALEAHIEQRKKERPAKKG